jgi:ATP-dependent DNA helicase RecQ
VQPFHGPYHLLAPPTGRHVVLRSTYLPVHLLDERQPGGTRMFVESAATIPGWALHRLLQGIFAKREFQPEGPNPRGQEIAIRRLLAGQDSVVLLPTGAGKSLIYQLAGLLMPGLTLVIDPIISLIDDQIDGLRRQGIDRVVGISSADTAGGTADDKLAQIQSGDGLFVFVSPERMQQMRFREALRTMSVATPVSLLVVDEAHCVSEWGHDFRTSYLDIGRVLRHVTADPTGAAPPLLALTGTASRSVLKDMLIELSVDRADPDIVITPVGFDRPELRYVVINAEDDELIPRLVGAINGLPSMFTGSHVPRTPTEFFRPRGDDSACGIVFCQTVRGRRGVVAISKAITESLRLEVPIYAGSAPKGWKNFGQVKRRNAERFKANEATLLAATKAYGMGIDKPNVRYIVHVGIPSSIEGYYQEAGRAGRDRRESVCVILHHPDGRKTLDWFHDRTFMGVENELASLRQILDELSPLERARNVAVPFGDEQEKGQRERAIHRLKLLGLVRDYTVDWGGKKYDVKIKPVVLEELDAALINFIRRNQPGRVPDFERRARLDAPLDVRERILNRARMMIEYVYDTIVASRRRAVDEMERLASEGRTDALVRDRILRYLALGRIAQEVEELLDREPFQFAEWMSLLDSVESSDDAREWRGATSRMLESDPDNPGLLLGRGLAEAAVPTGDVALFTTSVVSALRSAASSYFVQRDELARVVAWLSHWLGVHRREWRPLVYPIVERALAEHASAFLQPLEQAALEDPEPIAGELAVVLARRLQRTNQRVHQLNTALQEAE